MGGTGGRRQGGVRMAATPGLEASLTLKDLHPEIRIGACTHWGRPLARPARAPPQESASICMVHYYHALCRIDALTGEALGVSSTSASPGISAIMIYV